MRILVHALRELGLEQLGWFAIYKIGLFSGCYRRLEHKNNARDSGISLGAPRKLFPPPARLDLHEILKPNGEKNLLDEALNVINGRVRLFGGEMSDLLLRPPSTNLHWTVYAKGTNPPNCEDIKFIWEPARLGWAVLLARAYAVSGDERFCAVFWDRLSEFLEENPPYLGVNWVSSQEVAIRLIAMSFCWQVFSPSVHSTAERVQRMAQAIVEHAVRIPPTLAYARAQNNNHLLSEAAGLYTAGVLLSDHPSAAGWRRTGWRLFHQGIGSQIDKDGVYVQHSANYQRLVLQLALWMRSISSYQGDRFPKKSGDRLATSTRWLRALLDLHSGRVPNLGPNDGAYILPLTILPYEDYRPVLQAAAAVFLGDRMFEPGPWDEMLAWLGEPGTLSQASPAGTKPHREMSPLDNTGNPFRLQSPEGSSWAYLRAAHFNSRPGHADQLHVDLWWRGHNIAVDPGTYLYNAPPTWDNALAGSDVHNTVIVDESHQMLRAGRFLFLGWAQARVVASRSDKDGRLVQLAAEHDGYRGKGILHRRIIRVPSEGAWQVDDLLLPSSNSRPRKPHTACLNWLLPDWPWEVHQDGVRFLLSLKSPLGPVKLNLTASCNSQDISGETLFQVVRAGVLVNGAGEVKPHWGWYSATYGQKTPALAVRLHLAGKTPISFLSEWTLG